MRQTSLLIILAFLISCGDSDEKNFDIESTGGYSFLVQIPLDKYITKITKGYSDPELREIIKEAGDPGSTVPKTYFDQFEKESKDRGYKVEKYLNKANPDRFPADLLLDQVSEVLLEGYLEDLNACRDHLLTRYKTIPCQYNVFRVEEGRFRVEFDKTIDRMQALDLIFSSSQLEFYEVYTLGETMPGLLKIEEAITALTPTDTTETTAVESGEEMLLEDYPDSEMSDEEVKKQFPISSRLQFNFIQSDYGDYSYNETDPMIAFALFSDTAYLNAIFREPQYSYFLPRKATVFWSDIEEGNSSSSELCGLYFFKKANKAYRILPEDIDQAEVTESATSTANFDIRISFKEAGISKWSSLTATNANKHLAITLGERLLTVPMVQQRIIGGECTISGNYSEREAQRIADGINSSHLDFPLMVVEEKMY